MPKRKGGESKDSSTKKLRSEEKKAAESSSNEPIQPSTELIRDENIAEFKAQLEKVLGKLSDVGPSDERTANHTYAKSIEELDHIIKKSIKKDKAANSHLRHSPILFEMLFKHLLYIDNDILREQFVTKLNLIRIDTLPVESLLDSMKIFAEHVIKTNKLNESVGKVVATMSQIIDRSVTFSDSLAGLFENVFSGCRFDENLLIQFLFVINRMVLHKNSHIAESFLYKLYKIESTPDEEQTALSSKFNSISPINMSKLVHETILFLATYQIKKSVRVYERLFHLFLNVKTNTAMYLEHKSDYVKAEKDCIEQLSTHLGRNEQRNQRFLQAFKNILKRYSTKAVLNRFTASLFLSLSVEIHKPVRAEFNRLFIEQIEQYADLLHRSEQTKWIQKSTKRNCTQKELGNLFKYARQIEVLSVEKAINGLKELAFRLLNKCFEKQKVNERDSSVNIVRTFASNIIEDLFKNSKRSREVIVYEILERTATMNNESVSHDYSVYLIDRFEVIFNSKHTLKKLYFEKQNDMERTRLSKFIQSHLLVQLNRVQKQLLAHSQNPAFTEEFETIANHLKRLFHSARCFFFTCHKGAKSTFDELLSFLKTHSESKADARIRKICFQLLVIILKSLNISNPIELAPGSISSPTTDLYKSWLNENLKHSKELVSFCKAILNKQDAASKCFLYESLSSITKINVALGSSVSDLLKQQLDRVIVQVNNNDYYIDLSRCICTSNLHLIEPIDVLLNCVDLCTRTIDYEHNDLKVRLSQLLSTYLNQDAKQIFTDYKQQLSEWFLNEKFRQDPIIHLKLKHQLLLGIIDAFIEHMFMNEMFDKINKLFGFYQCTVTLMGIEIEELMTSCLQSAIKPASTSVSNKRKILTADLDKGLLNEKKKIPMKRFKTSTAASTSTTSVDGESNKENDENELVFRSQSTILEKRKPVRRPLADKTNVALTQTSQQSMPSAQQQLRTDFGQNILRNFTFSNIQFEHIPRISFGCLLKMIQFQLCSPDEGLFKSTKLFDNSALLRNIVDFMINEKFVDFVQKNLDKKMKSLVQNEQVYDPEALDHNQLFAILSQLWVCFCQRINGTERANGTSVYSVNMSQRFQPQFFTKTQRFIQFCMSIWTCVQRTFPQKLDELIKNERQHYDFGNPNVPSSIKMPVFKDSAYRARAYARFIFNCCQSVKSHMKPSPSTAAISNKCCAGLLSLVYEIMQTVELSEKAYEQLYTWLIDLLGEDIIVDSEVCHAVFKLLVHVCSKRNSPLLLLKHLSIEYFNYVFLNNDEDIYDETETETTIQYSFMSSSNQMDILQFLYKYSIESIDLLRWAVESNEWFNRPKLIALMCTQLECVTHTLINLLRSVSKLDPAELVLKLADSFYSFMNFLIQTDLFEKATDSEREMFTSLISSIGLRLHNQLPTQLNRIKDLILTDELQREEKANSSEILKIIGYKQHIRNLIENIDAFEQELIQISKSKRAPNLLKDFKVFIYDFQFSFSESKVTRTISGQQINKILVSSQSHDA